MHMIPPEKPAVRVDDRPNGPQLLAAIATSESAAGAVAKRSKKAGGLSLASLHSEERAVAVLCRGRGRDGQRLGVRFAGRTCEIELVAHGHAVLSGEWPFEISRLGRPLTATCDWESICWHSDSDVDYLELQVELSDDVIVQRHLALARKDRFLLMADAVLCPQGSGLEYCGVLPLAAGMSFCPAMETREGLVKAGSREQAGYPRSGSGSKKEGARRRTAAGKPLAQVLPLALPEWREARCGGELAATPRGLELRQETEGRRLFAPLFIDLDPRRFRRRLTWRALTVGESLAIVPPDRAAGYRVAIGKEQWLVYRSLGPVANRTLLGHNLSTETLVARFAAKGDVSSIIEIE